jgi:FkbM family methyltransferase
MINWPKNRNSKKNAIVLISTDFGPMMVNRFDFHASPNGTYGVGHNLLETSSFDSNEINTMLELLTSLRSTRGDGVVMVDGGANIGVHALSAGRLMQGWGSVISIEAQERIYYMTCGNVALNNLFNVRVLWNALDDKCGTIDIPVPDYFRPSSFGSLELNYSEKSEFIGQKISLTNTQPVKAITIDSLQLPRLDFFKLDVESMEEKVLTGATDTILRCKPIIHLEQLKSDSKKLVELLTEFGYTIYNMGPNLLCIHKQDTITIRFE